MPKGGPNGGKRSRLGHSGPNLPNKDNLSNQRLRSRPQPPKPRP